MGVRKSDRCLSHNTTTSVLSQLIRISLVRKASCSCEPEILETFDERLVPRVFNFPSVEVGKIIRFSISALSISFFTRSRISTHNQTGTAMGTDGCQSKIL